MSDANKVENEMEDMSATPETDAVMRIADNFGRYPGVADDGVTQEEAYHSCFASLERHARKLERQRDALATAAREALALLDKGASGWGVSKDLLRAALSSL